MTALIVLIGLMPMVPAVIFFLRQRSPSPVRSRRRLAIFNAIVGMMAAAIGFVWLASPSIALAAGMAAPAATSDPYASFAAAAAVGIGAIGAAIAVSSTGSAAVGTIAEKPETFGRALIFVGLAEGIAIYGLIIAFMILNR